MTLFAESYEKYRHLMEKDAILVVRGTVTEDDYSGGLRMNVEELWNLDGARAAWMRRLKIDLTQENLVHYPVEQLAGLLKPFCEGNCPVRIRYQQPQAVAEMDLGSEWNVLPSGELFRRLREQLGEESVTPEYG